MTGNDPVIIAGGGIGGLAAALALLRRGLPAVVFEQAPELGEIGAGLTLAANAILALESLGLGEGLDRVAVAPLSSAVIHYQGKESHVVPLQAMPRGRDLRIHRADLHTLLLDAIETTRPGTVQPNQRVDGFSQDESGVAVRLASGATVAGRALIGADGLRSRVREVAFGASPPNFTGYVAWRGLVAASDLPPEASEPMSASWRGPGRHFVRYLVRGGSLLNYVAFSREPGWETESWTERADLEELLALFADWHPSVLAIIRRSDPDQLFKWALFDRDPLPIWSEGRVTLLGDAAHPMLPFLGQGAGIAIEDAVVLARCLEAFPDVPAGLRRYDALRRARGELVQRLSRLVGTRMMEPVPIIHATDEEDAVRQQVRAIAFYDAANVPLEG